MDVRDKAKKTIMLKQTTMRHLLCIICLFNMTDLFGQCSITFIGDPDYCGMCNGNLTASPTGQPPFSYSWSTGDTTQTISGLCPGLYSLTVTDSDSCVTTAPVAVSGTSFSATVFGTDATCNGCCDGTGDVTASGGYTPYSYSWTCTGQTTSSITGLCAGNCFVQITDGMGCSFFLPLTINEPPTGINNPNFATSILLYPNPTNQNVTLEFDNSNHDICTLTIYDAHGRLVRSINGIAADKLEIETSNLTNGIYFFHLRNDKKIIAARKLKIEQ